MLDVSRHFFTKEEVKKYMVQMARYKYNVLHLHLSDDQGWRIEIKSLPQLTSVGAWRVKRSGLWGEFLPALANETSYRWRILYPGGHARNDQLRKGQEYYHPS